MYAKYLRFVTLALVLALVVPSGATNASSLCGGGFVGGGIGNSAGECAVVTGGRGNTAAADYSTISGGNGNSAEGDSSTIGGGRGNSAKANFTTIAGGNGNVALGFGATVAGGRGNSNSAEYGSIGGGNGNQVSGANATVPGGRGNLALGENSFAAGIGAVAQHDGSFVWADGTRDATGNYPSFASTSFNQFSVRATGGVKFVLAVDGKGNATKWCEATISGDFRCKANGVITSFSQLTTQNAALQQQMAKLEERIAKLEQP